MTGMHVQRMRGQRAGADVENNGQTFSRNRVQDFLHEDQALSRCKVRYASAGYCKTFARAGGAVFGFRFDESQFVAPEVLDAVGNLRLISATHRGG